MRFATVALVLLASVSFAADKFVTPPTLPEPARIVVTSGSAATTPAVPSLDVGRFVFLSLPSIDGPITYDVDGSSFVSIFTVKSGESYPGFRQGDTKAQSYKAPDSKSEVLMLFGESPGTVNVAVWGVKDGKPIKLAVTTISVGGARPPPVDPQPVPVPPGPVTSFRVIFTVESATTLNAKQNAVCGSKAVRDYLNAKTTKDGAQAGWRIYDPQSAATNDAPGIKAVWDAAKPKLTADNCMIVQVNDKIEIVPFPANADEALKTLQTYGGK